MPGYENSPRFSFPGSGLDQLREQANRFLMDSVHEARQHCHHSPANQDSGDPHPRSDLVQQQIDRDFKEEIAEKENSEDQSVLNA